MPNTPPAGRSKPKTSEPHDAKVHEVPVDDLFPYARSFHAAAKTLLQSLQPNANPPFVSDLCPVLLLYRQAIELHLKGIVLGGGGNFLPTKPDPISVRKSRSVVWLAQFVSQIVIALRWEDHFTCEGVGDLSAFKRAIEEINAVDPGFYTFRSPVDAKDLSSVREFGRKMDALLTLLASTADALEAEWDLRSEATDLAGSPKETIQ